MLIVCGKKKKEVVAAKAVSLRATYDFTPRRRELLVVRLAC
jgi:hypothetical protein